MLGKADSGLEPCYPLTGGAVDELVGFNQIREDYLLANRGRETFP